MDWLKCNICFNTYNESSIRPRSLTCGHTYCERCLNNMIQNQTITCPLCRKIHDINSVLEIPINFNLEGLLKSLNTCSQDLTEEAVSSTIEEKSYTDEKRETLSSLKSLLKQQELSLSAQKELLKTSAGMCNEHPNKECLFRCSVHMCWVCELCIEEHGDHPKHNCKIFSFKEEIEDRKQEHKQSLKDERKSCNVFLSVIERHISFLTEKRESHISLIHNLQEFLDMHKKEEESLQIEMISFQSIIEKGENVRQKLLDVEETVLNAATLDESNAARELVKNKKAEARQLIDTSQKEVDEGKIKIENMAYSTEYRDKCEYLHHELEKIINRSGAFEKSANKTKSNNIEFARTEDVPGILENLIGMKNKEAKNEAKKEALSEFFKAIRCFVSRDPKKNKAAKNVEVFRLKIILRLLQLSSLNAKMNSLEAADNVITNASNYTDCQGPIGEDEWLTVKAMVEWIKEDLADIWNSQHGAHQAIVNNLHGIIFNLALDISPDQFELLYDCFQTLWSSSSMKQKGKLLEIGEQLFNNDEYRVMAHKVLSLLWTLAHSDDVPNKTMEQAIYAHVKILDYTCSHLQKMKWLECCVEELKHDKQVLAALKHIRGICCTYSEDLEINSKDDNSRTSVILKLQNQLSVIGLVVDNLTKYMTDISCTVKNNSNLNPEEIFPDGHYNHIDQIQERLYFIQFLLRNGDLWLCSQRTEQIWNCLVEKSIFAVDQESCFKWLSIVTGDDDLDPEMIDNFFENKILQLDPSLLTDNGMDCFNNFFKAANQKESKLVLVHKNLIGLDYVWSIILYGSEDIGFRASELLRKIFTKLEARLKTNEVLIHDDFISTCISHFGAIYDNVLLLVWEKDIDSVNKVVEETTRMRRVLTVLYKYIFECDSEFVNYGFNIPDNFQDMLKKYSAMKLYYEKW